MDGSHWKGVLAVLAILVVVIVTALPGANKGDNVAAQPAKLTPLEIEGKRVYDKYCVGCHGEAGDGNGVSAKWLSIKPRDFRSGIIRFASVPVGSLPRIEDYVRAIREGLTGSAMPAWKEIPDNEVIAVSHYIKTFAPRWKTGEQEGRQVVLFDDPFVSKDPATYEKNAEKAIALGRKIYHGLAKCVECHPSYHRTDEEWVYLTYTNDPRKGGQMRENPHQSARDKTDEYTNAPLIPPDFVTGPVKAGGDLMSLAQTIGAGVGGARMPAWAPTFRTSAKWYERFDGKKDELADEIDEDYKEWELADDLSDLWSFVDDAQSTFGERSAVKFWALVYYIHALVPEKFGGAAGKWGRYATPPIDKFKTKTEKWED